MVGLKGLVSGRSVTVIVTCYSGEPFFDEAVRSIERQTLSGVNIILHDNGCAPAYRDKIRAAAARCGARIIRSEVNRYGEGLRYDVLPQLKTKYVAILHDDDYYEPTKIESGLHFLRSRGLDYLFTERRHVDAAGAALDETYEEVNTRPFKPGDFPYQHLADTYYRGLRLHFSTLIIKSSLAKSTLLGDPYLPRITDSLFMQRLLLDRRYRGAAIPGKLTNVRVHGANDMLYSKFGEVDRAKEFGLLQFAEYSLFRELVDSATDVQLRETLRIFPGVQLQDDEDCVDMLVMAALAFHGWGNAKPLMGAYCIHTAWTIDALKTLRRVRELSASRGLDIDTNKLMASLYHKYINEVGNLLCPPQVGLATSPLVAQLSTRRAKATDLRLQIASLADDSAAEILRLKVELGAMESAMSALIMSRTWRLTFPLRWLLTRLKRLIRPTVSSQPCFAPQELTSEPHEALNSIMSGLLQQTPITIVDIEEWQGWSKSRDMAQITSTVNRVLRERLIAAPESISLEVFPEVVVSDVLALGDAETASRLFISPGLTLWKMPEDGSTSLWRPGARNIEEYRSWQLNPSVDECGRFGLYFPALTDEVTRGEFLTIVNAYPLELEENGEPFCWTGPEPTTRVYVPVFVSRNIIVELKLVNMRSEAAREIIISHNGRKLDMDVISGGQDTSLRSALFSMDDSNRVRPLDLTITYPRTFRPGGCDHRTLGIQIRHLAIVFDLSQ